MDWFRAYHGMASDPKWRVVAQDSGQPAHAVVAVWLAMLECASQAEERGSLDGWKDRVAGAALDLGVDAVAAVRSAMHGLVLDGDRLIAWEKRQPAREEDGASTERVRRFRERQRSGNAVKRGETQGNAPEQIQSREEGGPPLTPPPKDLPEDWREAAGQQREERGLPPADLAAQWQRFVNRAGAVRRGSEEWRGRWLNWALEAHGAASRVVEPGKGHAVDARPAREAEFWEDCDRLADTTGRWAPRLRGWAILGIWAPPGVDWGPRPGEPGCQAPAAMLAHAIRKRDELRNPAADPVAPPKPGRKRGADRCQPEILMPVAGGAGGGEEEARTEPVARRRSAGV